MRLLLDENFDRRILDALRKRIPQLEIMRVQDVGLTSARDERIVDWIIENDFVLLTRDARTMIDHILARIDQGEQARIILVRQTCPSGQAVEEILTLVECSLPGDWANPVWYIPLT